jgi:hypothetical protein
LGVTIYWEGDTPTYTVIPNDGYVVDKFKIDGNVADLTNNQYTFSPLKDDYNITVTFKKATYTITAAAAANGTIKPLGDTTYEAGATPTYTFTPNDGYLVDKVTVDGSEVTITDDNTYTFSSLTMNHKINVTFVKSWSIQATAMDNGNISNQGLKYYKAGATPTYTITPNDGYLIDKVTVDGSVVTITNNKYTFAALTADHEIKATFKKKATYTITAEAAANGTIQPLGDTTYEAGATPTYKFLPDKNYRVYQVYIDDWPVTFANDQYTFSALDHDHTIYVTFERITY